MTQQKSFVREQKSLLKSTYLILGIGLLVGLLAITLAAELALRFEWVFPGDNRDYVFVLLGVVGLLAVDFAYMAQMRSMRDKVLTTIRRSIPETRDIDKCIVRHGITGLRIQLGFHTLMFVGLMWAAMWLSCSATSPHQAWRGLMAVLLVYSIVLYALHGIATISSARLLQDVRPDFGMEPTGPSKKR